MQATARPDEIAAALGITPRRVNQLASEAGAARADDQVEILPIVTLHVRRLAAKVDTADARRGLIRAQTERAKLDREIRDRERVPVQEVRDLVTKVMNVLHDYKQQASGMVFYARPDIPEGERRVLAQRCYERLMEDIRRLDAQINTEIEEFIQHRSPRLFRRFGTPSE